MSDLRDITENDIRIMRNMYDMKTSKGLSKAKAMTIDEIKEKTTELSESKIRDTIRLLLTYNYVDYGVKRGKKKTYHITNDGLNYVKSIKELVINLIEEE